MKKLILSLFVILTIFTITACKKEEKKEEQNNNNQEQKEEVKTNGNSVVLYFSATGTTKKIAERIASKSGSDIIEIVPKEEYKSADLNYNSDCRANR